MIDPTFYFRILLAALLGALIGFDRQKRHKPAGLRTHILVAIGSALFTYLSVQSFPEDGARIISNIVVGIGFLGAGTIWRFHNHVTGLTTAASMWTTAGMGMAVGLGFYFESLFVAILVFGVLELVKLDDFF